MSRFKGSKYRWGCLGVSWCIYILMASISAFKATIVAVVSVLLPVLAIDAFCSLSVLKTLKKPPPGDREMVQEKKKRKKRKEGDIEEVEKRSADGSEKKERVMWGKGEKNCMKRKAFITIAFIQVVLTFNYLPFIIIMVLFMLISFHSVKCQCLPVALAAACSFSYLQPVLYLHKLGKLPGMKSQNHKTSHTNTCITKHY